jgi:hypothetical protein
MSNTFETIKKSGYSAFDKNDVHGKPTHLAQNKKANTIKRLPSDDEFFSLLNGNILKNAKSVEEIKKVFYNNSNFFFSYADKEKILRAYNEFIGSEISRSIVEKAERILAGKISLLGYKNLDFGSPVNWHYEPLSSKTAEPKASYEFSETDITEIGNVRIIWELNRHQHFFTLGLAYWITGDEIFVETFNNHLESWMSQNPPGFGINWINSFELSLRVISWLWAFRFFENSVNFPNWTFLKALKFLYLHARSLEDHLSSAQNPTSEALSLYYLGTQMPFFKESEKWRQTAKRILFEEIETQVLKDGAYFEHSSWYARYTADFYIHFLILHELSEPEQDKKEIEKIKTKLQHLLDFLMHLTRPDGTIPLIGDLDGGRMLPLVSKSLFKERPNDFRETLSTASVIFRRSDYKFIAKELSEATVWLTGIEGIKIFRSLQAHEPKHVSKFFGDGGYFIMRDGWDLTDNYMLIHAGLTGTTSNRYSHADNLSIEVAPLGRTTLVDSGSPIYFESDLVRNYFRSTLAHNVLSIDAKPSSELSREDWKTKATSKIHLCLIENRFDFFEVSHDGYLKLSSPALHKRSILFVKNDYWIIRDFVETSGKHDYQLNFRFHSDIELLSYKREGEKRFFIEEEQDSTILRIFCFGDNGNWSFSQGWLADGYGHKRKAPVFQFISSGTGPQEFFTFILPDFISDEEKPRVTELEIIGARAFWIRFRNYDDFLIYTDGEIPLFVEPFVSDFRFIWARTSKDNQAPEEYILIDGKKFWLNGRKVIEHPQGLNFAVARQIANKLNVRTDDAVFTISMPQMTRLTKISQENENTEK